MKECDILGGSTHTLTPPTYFHGSGPPTFRGQDPPPTHPGSTPRQWRTFYAHVDC